jgi:hypothetical protein
MNKLVRYVAVFVATCLFASDAFALTASRGLRANAGPMAAKVYHRHRHGNSGSPNFKHWCAYNCYAISPCYRGCLGRYGYRFYAYDQDLPFRYRYDRDASPIDNGFALVGAPFFERAY